MRKRFIEIGAGVLAVAALAGGGVAWATAHDDDTPLTGTAFERATKAALAHTGGGTVTESEAGDDGAAYSVEVRLRDGKQVEVNLDEQFRVVGQEGDDDSAGEANDGDD
jgi:uncharacterized membrane protein YkoI